MYSVQHIAGEYNIVADLFSRWGIKQLRQDAEANVSRELRNLQSFNAPGPKNQPVEPGSQRTRKLRFVDPEETNVEPFIGTDDEWDEVDLIFPVSVQERITRPNLFEHVNSRVSPMLDLEGQQLVYPSLMDIQRAQEAATVKPKNATLGEHGLWKVDGKIWLPETILPFVIAVAHGLYGHPGINTLVTAIKRQFYARDISKYCRDINRRCLNCTGEHTPKIIRRKLGQQFYSDRRNGILHLDFLYIHKKPKLLVIREDHTGKAELFPVSQDDAIAAADGILWWRAHFGLRRDTLIVTDGGSHFANSLMKELSNRLHFRHHITVAYSPWSNGKAERVNREILKLFRVLLAELKMNETDWPKLISQVQFQLNNTPRARLNGLTSDEYFLVKAGDGPLDLFMTSEEDYSIRNIPVTAEKVLEAFANLDAAFEEMHKDVVDVQTRLRVQQRRKNDEQLGVDDIQYAIGEWVLVSRAVTKGRKLQLQWLGPFQIVDTLSNYVYKVRSIINDEEKAVHVRRLRFYENKYLTITEEMAAQIIRDTRGFEVDKILDARWNDIQAEYELKCRWWGFDSEDDSWETYTSIIETCPDKVDRFLLTADDEPVIKALRNKRSL
jgi:hypothetical protein